MLRFILAVSFLFALRVLATPPKPVALFLDCNIGEHYSNAIRSTIENRGEEFIVIPCKDFHQKMGELAKQNVYIKTLFASGHDGDGSVYPNPANEKTKGKFDPSTDIAEINKKYPQLFSKVQTYYPMGCYSTSMSNVNQYLQVMPNVKYICGFFGAAHSAHRKKSQNYLVEMLEQEENIIQAGNIEEFRKATSVLNVVKTDLNIGLYRSLSCNPLEPKGYMIEVDHEAEKPINRTVAFDKDECKKKKKEFERNMELFLQYADGEIDVPLDTDKGQMRQIYSFFRQNEYCYDIVKDDKDYDLFPAASQAFVILFHQNVQRSFKKYYQKEINNLKNQIQSELNGKKISAPQRKVLQTALGKIKILSEQDMGLWDRKKVLDVSVDLQDVSEQIQNLNFCGSDEANCVNYNLTFLANKYTELLSDQGAPEEWHSFNPNKRPIDPPEEVDN